MEETLQRLYQELEYQKDEVKIGMYLNPSGVKEEFNKGFIEGLLHVQKVMKKKGLVDAD